MRNQGVRITKQVRAMEWVQEGVMRNGEEREEKNQVGVTERTRQNASGKECERRLTQKMVERKKKKGRKNKKMLMMLKREREGRRIGKKMRGRRWWYLSIPRTGGEAEGGMCKRRGGIEDRKERLPGSADSTSGKNTISCTHRTSPRPHSL